MWNKTESDMSPRWVEVDGWVYGGAEQWKNRHLQSLLLLCTSTDCSSPGGYTAVTEMSVPRFSQLTFRGDGFELGSLFHRTQTLSASRCHGWLGIPCWVQLSIHRAMHWQQKGPEAKPRSMCGSHTHTHTGGDGPASTHKHTPSRWMLFNS